MKAQISAPCDKLGFQPPPEAVYTKLLPHRGAWRMLVWSQAGAREDLLAWLSEHGTFRLSVLDTGDDRLLVVDTRELPHGWAWLATEVEVPTLRLDPGGSAHLELTGSGERLQALVEELGLPGSLETLEAENIGAEGTSYEQLLTDHQHEALLRALSAGYYEVPRRIRLQELADELGTSISSLSELLRRAEQRLVRAYVRATPRTGVLLDGDVLPWAGAGEDG